MSALGDKLDAILDGVDDPEEPLSREQLINDLKACVDMAYELEVVDVRCSRCDRTFRSLSSVKYCTKECELGGVEMPYQTRALQQYHLDKVGRGKA